MAGSKPGVHVVKLKPIIVPHALFNGDKFIKWDDDASAGTPVTLRVDTKGYVLYWRDQHKDTDCLDISVIRDTRTGKYAKIPKDPRLREAITMGSPDIPLEEKLLTIVYGTDMVNLSFLNFAASSKETVKEWATLLFQYATNLLALNSCPLTFLEKCHTRLVHVTNSEGKLPVKNILKMFNHKDDKKRAEKALESAHLPSGKGDMISPNKFTLEDFYSFYRHLLGRTEVDKIFHDLGAKKKPYLTVEQFQEFLNTQQRDPRLNEILYPFCDKAKAQTLIDQFENNSSLAGKGSETPKGHLSQEGFMRYLMSDENALIAPDKLDLSEDMDQPLSHYFINSSHNTYLTGHQLTGKSSVEIYRQALLTGCRCVELDCWDGKGADEEPIITHGFTMCTEIIFKEVIEAIAESAFKVSDYPVILSFENHCSPKQQAKMAQHCRNILGDMLLTDPLDSHPLKSGKNVPSPAQLRRKFIIKAKKVHRHRTKTKKVTQDGKAVHKPAGADGATEGAEGEVAEEGVEEKHEGAEDVMEHDDGASSSESEIESEEEEGLDEEEQKKADVKKEKGTASQEAEAGMEMSALVNYVQPARFQSFENANKRNRTYECTSFVETQATALLKEFPVDFVNFNKRQISRIYPKGTRVDSSNYMPQIFWNAGCQLVALNFQTLDLAMQLNLGIFEYNGRSGFILKPDFMRRKDRRFDPFAESTVDGIVAGTVEVKIIAGQFLTEKKVGTFVEVDMYGLPADTVRKKFRTKVIPGNGISPIYDEDPFVFRKVVLPNLATLRICACDESGKLLGHRVLPVEGLRPGYRHITLRNELNQPQNLGTLFVHITVKDYVPDSFADFAAALANPIAYQSQLEKHAQQLAVLEEDFDTPDDESQTSEVSAPSKEPPPSELSRTRNASLLNRKSTPLEGTPSNLSRMGSLQAKHMQKQDTSSSIAGVSAGSGSSGTVPPMSRMISSVTPNTENGGVTTQSVATTSRLNGPKCTSLPGSPLHSVHSTAAAATTSENNGAVKPSSQKIDVVQTTRLKDPDVIESASMDTLKDTKQYQKVALKMEKELESLRKKQEKAKTNLSELHELQEEKLILSHVKSKTSVEKNQRKSIKRASKHGTPDEITTKNQQELTALISDQEKKVRDLKKDQMESMITLCKEHLHAELDLQSKHQPIVYDTLDSLVTNSLSSQLKQLDEIHDKEVNELKKKLDTANREEMKLLAKKHKDKNELARIKREAMQKHIQMAVHEREKLRDILMKRKGEVEDRHMRLKSEVSESRQKRMITLKAENEEKCSKVEEERRRSFKSSSPQQASAAPSSSPTEKSSPTSTNSLRDEHINQDEQDTHMAGVDSANGETGEAVQQ